MSDAFYTELKNIANDVFAEFKQNVVLIERDIRDSGDPLHPGVPGSVLSVDTYTLDATVRGVTARHLADTNIRSTDLVVSFAVSAELDGVRVEIAPLLNDRFMIMGRRHASVQITRLPAAGPAVSWEAVVRS